MSEITPNHQPTISADDVDEMINPFRPLHQSMVPSAEELTSFPPFPPHVPTELESVLNDLTSPWAIRNSTPRIPGEAQVDFPRRIWRRWTVVLSSQLHIIALRQSIALAQRLILHQYIGSSDPVAARVHDFCASNPWTINLETEMSHNGTMARIASQRPNDIFLSFSYLDQAADSAFEIKRNPSEANEMYYKRHILLLALTIAHALNYSLLCPIKESGSEENGIEEVPDLNWEEKVFDGNVVGCWVEKRGQLIRPESIAIQSSGENPSHFVVSDEHVKAFVDEEKDWQNLLPLKPTGPRIDGLPLNSSFRLKGYHDEWTGDSKVKDKAIVPTRYGCVVYD